MELLSPKGLKNKLAYTILKERAGVDSKSNKSIGKLAEFVTIAIEEERFLNRDINDCKGKTKPELASYKRSLANYYRVELNYQF